MEAYHELELELSSLDDNSLDSSLSHVQKERKTWIYLVVSSLEVDKDVVEEVVLVEELDEARPRGICFG